MLVPRHERADPEQFNSWRRRSLRAARHFGTQTPPPPTALRCAPFDALFGGTPPPAIPPAAPSPPLPLLLEWPRWLSPPRASLAPSQRSGSATAVHLRRSFFFEDAQGSGSVLLSPKATLPGVFGLPLVNRANQTVAVAVFHPREKSIPPMHQRQRLQLHDGSVWAFLHWCMKHHHRKLGAQRQCKLAQNDFPGPA